MREYGQIQCSYWQSSDAQAFSDAAKVLGAYLMTGPHSNGLGCYRLPDGYVMADFGWSADKVQKTFEELFRNGFAYRFETVVFIPNFLRWNKIANHNVAKARQAEFEALPKGESKTRLARAMLEFGNHWADGFRTVLETVSQTLSKGLPEQNPTQPYPTLPDPEPAKPSIHDDVIAAYHELLPELPKIKIWSEDRKRTFDARIRETVKRGKPANGVGYWRDFFAKVARSDWLCGRAGKEWRADWDWLMGPENFRHVLEGRYDKKGESHGRSFSAASTAALG